jgi:hypothetical protein
MKARSRPSSTSIYTRMKRSAISWMVLVSLMSGVSLALTWEDATQVGFRLRETL